MTLANDLTAEALAGFDGKPNPWLYSSPNWYAHSLGSYLLHTGRTTVYDVRMSGGSAMRANGMVFKHTGTGGWMRIA